MPRHQNNAGGSGGKREKNLTYKQKSSIQFVDESDPPFLKAMKEKLGYQEPKIEDKFTEEPNDEDDERDPDDILNMKESERPTIVALNNKHLTTEEVDEEVKKYNEEEDRRKIEEGRITFKKPTKRPADEGDNANEEGKSDEKRTKTEPQKANTKMLSFGDDEEE